MSETIQNADDTGAGGRRTPFITAYDRSETPPSIAVVDAIASVEGVDPVSLSTVGGTTLYDHVDPDALDRLLGAEGVQISFEVGMYTVQVVPDTVTVVRK